MPKDLASGDQQVELAEWSKGHAGCKLGSKQVLPTGKGVWRLTKETTWAGAKKQPTINSSGMSVSQILERSLKLFID